MASAWVRAETGPRSEPGQRQVLGRGRAGFYGGVGDLTLVRSGTGTGPELGSSWAGVGAVPGSRVSVKIHFLDDLVNCHQNEVATYYNYVLKSSNYFPKDQIS